MPDSSRTPRRLFAYLLAIPVIALVYVGAFGSRVWAALRPSVALVLGATVIGTVYADGLPRVVRIDGFAMDMIPEGQMVLIVNKDQPGVIGTVGTSFGDANVNIADMVISREFDDKGEAHALMLIKIDSPAPDALLNRLRARPGIVRAKTLVLPPRTA